MIHERASSVKMGPVPISLARVRAPAFSRRSNFRAQSRVARPCAQEKPPAQNAVREQRTRNRSTRPYFDTLVTFLWYDLLISGGLRSVGWGTSLPRVTTLSFPPLFLVCNTLLLNGGARTSLPATSGSACCAPVRWASALGGCKVEPQSHPTAARWLTRVNRTFGTSRLTGLPTVLILRHR